MELNELDKITQLLKTGECSNQILAIQLAVGQGLSIDEIVELCLCLEKVVYSNGGIELILCDYGISHDIQYNHNATINHFIDRFSLTKRDNYLDNFNEYVNQNEVDLAKIRLIKEIIESVI